MEKIRIGNDIRIRWEIHVIADDGSRTPYDLEGKNLKLYLSNRYNRSECKEFTTEGNAVAVTFPGRKQKHLGSYQITLVENEGQDGMHTVDECEAFRLVAYTCLEGGDEDSSVKITHLRLNSVMHMGAETGGASREELEALIGLSIPHDMNEDFIEDFAI